MFIYDYEQCLRRPYFGSEQPGDTFYLSPMNINLFGIYNCATDKMNSYLYPSYESGKGGDDVCSLLWLNLKNIMCLKNVL